MKPDGLNVLSRGTRTLDRLPLLDRHQVLLGDSKPRTVRNAFEGLVEGTRSPIYRHHSDILN